MQKCFVLHLDMSRFEMERYLKMFSTVQKAYLPGKFTFCMLNAENHLAIDFIMMILKAEQF